MCNRIITNAILKSVSAFSVLLGGSSPAAQANIIVNSRYSEVWYNTTNLTDGIPPSPPPWQLVSTTSLTSTFDATVSATFEHITVTGAYNTGMVNVSQHSAISPSSLFADTRQNGFVTTDFNHPAIYTNSLFSLDFEVGSPVEMVLAGLIEGSSTVGHSDFARVILSHGFGPVFDTGLGHTFPFYFTFMPGNRYNLRVEASGSAFLAPPLTPLFEDTSSRAQAQLTAVPEPGSLILAGIVPGWLSLSSARRKRQHSASTTIVPDKAA